MGVASPLFTRRTEATVARIRLVEMSRPVRYDAARQPAPDPNAGPRAALPLPELAADVTLTPHAAAAAPRSSAARKAGQP
jgi:hypothetical protein